MPSIHSTRAGRSAIRILVSTVFSAAALSGIGGVSGCGSRSEAPTLAPDSTLVYPSRESGGVSASITFCKRISNKTGCPLGEARIFELSQGGRVRAAVQFTGLDKQERPQLVHLVWVRPDGRDIFKKSLEVPPDQTELLESSMTISPRRRDPGRYTFQVYLFRELIAEKTFDLVSPNGAPAPESEVRPRDSTDGGM